MDWIYTAYVVWASVLSWYDWQYRRLPNALTLGGAAAALLVRYGCGGVPMMLDGLAAGAVAGAFMLLPFLARGAGGGDVKMVFAAGIMVGWGRPVIGLLWMMSLAGLVLGIGLLAARRLDGSRLRHYARSMFDWRYDRAAGVAALPSKESDQVRIPFGPAIAVGLLLSLPW